MKKTKLALFQSVVSLLLCISMLAGTTFAWFTDSVTSANNIIKSGKLDVEMFWADGTQDPETVTWTDASTGAIFDYSLWEPGYTQVRHIKIENKGNLALKYQLHIQANGTVSKLSDVIDVYFLDPAEQVSARTELTEDKKVGTLTQVLAGMPGNASGSLKADEIDTVTIALKMQETAGNEYQNLSIGSDFKVILLATQEVYESDSFGSDYDKDATFDFPENTISVNVSGDVSVADGKVTEATTLAGGSASAVIPAGVQMAEGNSKLTLTISEMAKSGANLTLSENEAMRPLNVHVEGIAANNTIPMEIYIKEAMPKGLNMGNYKFYHVENGNTVEMTMVDTFTAHNQFKYDPATGDVTLYMATFSEVALVADTENAWEGNFDYTWYTNAVAPVDGEAVTEYTIANADQLAAFGAIVGGMNGQTKDSFAGKTVKLISDVNLGDNEENNKDSIIFYPIGYHNSTGSYKKISGGSVTSSVSSFEGTFDGSGHTIKNFYQNTWEMFGDYNDGYSGTPNHYKDAMGLFGYVLNGTVKNLTVSNFSSDGEYTPTGVIAAYADGNSTFENIAITKCNPRVYNTGNGGIIGIAGDTSTANDDHITLKNITVDNSNKISALWGSWDVACGGLVGMYRGNVDGSGNATGDTISFENCHVSAIIDVYNDVCANYQYYAYRYSGMIIGSVRHNTTSEGKTIPNMTGISATGCTVNYGDWNDYYYCEFEKNTMASYSEDYQFSRVPHSELNFTDSNGNGVVDANERASVIGCKHTHTEEENHKAIYLPFHQLFTGYSWGVSSIGLKEYSGIVTDLGITEGGQQESVEKFVVNLDFDESLVAGQPYEVSTLFAAIDGAEINGSAVQVSVSAMNNSGIVGTYEANTTNWTEGTLSFNKVDGMCTVTIQDYNFCKPTSFVLKDGKLYQIEKFNKKFTENFLYRVGNQNPVPISALFEKKQDVELGNVTVTSDHGKVDISNGWESGTIDLTGYTGLITVTIQDDAYCMPTELTLEVVDAVNVLKPADWKDNTNSVLLSNIELTSEKRITGKKTFYGNGFTIDATGAPYKGVTYDYQSYVIYLENSNLDNVIIEGMVYPDIGGTKDQDYYRALIMTNGDCKISNCFLSNTASPIRNGGNLELKDTVLKGGAYANLDIRNGHTILDNVTTINQFGEGIISGEKEVVGLGVVVYHEGGTDELKITIRNGLKQYNLLSKKQAGSFEGDAKTVVDKIFSESAFSAYRYNDGSTQWINTGIISMNDYFTEDDLADERTSKEGYSVKGSTVSLLGKSRYCVAYSYKPSSGNEASNIKPSVGTQGAIPPTAVFDFKTKNYIAKTEGSNDHCVEDNGKVSISMDEGDTFNWDTSILNVEKNGKTLAYTVTMNGTDYTGNSIAFAESGIYTLVYTYTDGENYHLETDGSIKTYDVSYTQTLTINVAVIKASAKNAVFSFGSGGTEYAARTVVVGDKTYVMPDVNGNIEGKIGSKVVDGVTIYYPIVNMYTSDGKTDHKSNWYACFPIFKDAVQIIDYADKGTGDAVTYNQKTVTIVDQIPATLKAVDPKNAFLYSMNSTNYPPPTDPTAVSGAVCYTCNRTGLDGGSNNRPAENTVAEYTYTDNAQKVYYYYVGYYCEPQTCSGGCVTPDTLVTLADGTQKEIQHVSNEDKLLVWNFYKGMYQSVPATLIVNHGYGDQTVIELTFDDGTVVNAITAHSFFDADTNQWELMNAHNAHEFIGHNFVQANGKGYTTVTLVDVDVYTEYTESYSLVSAYHYNFITENMFSLTNSVHNMIAGLEVGENMTYDQKTLARDVEQYGLYTYADFADYITREQYVAFNGDYLKISVEKGYITFDEILSLIETYLR